MMFQIYCFCACVLSTGNKVAAKLICYTRSDSLIHQLPLMYPMSAYSTTEEFERSKNCIETFIHDKVYIISYYCLTLYELFRLKTWSFANFQAFPPRHLSGYSCSLSRTLLRIPYLFW